MLKLSNYPFKTAKSDMKISDNLSTSFLLRGGFIRQEIAGVYNYLHLGYRVLDNIEKIITKHLEKLGSLKIKMSAVGSKEHRSTTPGRKDIDVLFKLPFSDNKEHFLNPTHEDIVTPIIKEFITSYKNLPVSIFQIQNKYRNEKRAKSGILRGREFLMKDMYSFHDSLEDLNNYYEEVIKVYHKIFEELGIGDSTFFTYASGGDFSKYSHEFQTLLEIGEDEIYLDKKTKVAINEEVLEDEDINKKFDIKSFDKINASEIGNIFKLGTRFTDAFDLGFTDKDGKRKQVYMGCYGIGISRTMGIIAEKLMDDKGLVRPESIAPYQRYIIVIGDNLGIAEDLAKKLENKGETVILDDRDVSFGNKVGDADLLGIPKRIIVSNKTLEKGGVEYKHRTEKETKIISLDYI